MEVVPITWSLAYSSWVPSQSMQGAVFSPTWSGVRMKFLTIRTSERAHNCEKWVAPPSLDYGREWNSTVETSGPGSSFSAICIFSFALRRTMLVSLLVQKIEVPLSTLGRQLSYNQRSSLKAQILWGRLATVSTTLEKKKHMQISTKFQKRVIGTVFTDQD